MIPYRYGGIAHTLKLIFNEEGLKGLYRGYSCFLIQTNIMMIGMYLYSNIQDYKYVVQNS